jgi:hypothetical protein
MCPLGMWLCLTPAIDVLPNFISSVAYVRIPAQIAALIYTYNKVKVKIVPVIN